MRTIFSLCLLFMFSILQASEHLDIQKLETRYPKSTELPRIQTLWPKNCALKLAIETTIPKDFITKQGGVSFNNYFIWGPKEVVDAYDFSDPSTQKGSVFPFQYTTSVYQAPQQTFTTVNQGETGCVEKVLEKS